ncbi:MULTISPECIES: cation transporter [Pseudoalteromonas]|jgi:Co/Zn/Cd efflux system component|uniref:Cation transporter n=4 Tax=Pseudoalteromonas TaxID=53246 RepID=A0A4Q7EKT0_9GAMM|nr:MULTISPECIES: cation transporter [Pseudoalteromonas]MAH27567.1 cation transporter [Pseudoalteromonadaceae bacterium]MBE1287087.1 cation transporter [Alteromonadaceae bacterium]MEC8325413.1 cation transporter [Pseudomonadota bacterium]UJX26142.1 cation transporter [Pseudoalteromonas sp. CF6-2]WOC26929.1 cation transporter [Pseudoalteromonas sp. N1230-9]|tara:strand:- start:579 stop:1232 length:654 start_codon:yes stop_codon:yes gene_type:complete
MSGCGCEVELKDAKQKHVLYWLLGINAVMFCVEITVGLYANSTALIADSMDMLADAIVYGIALYAVSRSLKHKANAALISGYFQLTLGILVIFDIVRRLGEGEPHSWFMIGFGFVALIANVICLVLIRMQSNGEVHMRASWIFSANDVIANLGVIAAGVLVMLLDSRWPDIVIGSVIATLILRGAYLIITDAKKELSNAELTSENNSCSGSKSKSCS